MLFDLIGAGPSLGFPFTQGVFGVFQGVDSVYDLANPWADARRVPLQQFFVVSLAGFGVAGVHPTRQGIHDDQAIVALRDHPIEVFA